jgi:hypothetical protein
MSECNFNNPKTFSLVPVLFVLIKDAVFLRKG